MPGSRLSNRVPFRWDVTLRLADFAWTDICRRRLRASLTLCGIGVGVGAFANTARTMDILRGIQQRRGMTLMIVTHEDEIAESAPRQIRMRDGRIV